MHIRELSRPTLHFSLDIIRVANKLLCKVPQLEIDSNDNVCKDTHTHTHTIKT